ncbi:unnamed protein product, partial [Laminaria digitata]
ESAYTPSSARGGGSGGGGGGLKRLDAGRAAAAAAASHNTPALDRGIMDDTLLAAVSLVSFQKPRLNDAPRLRGPLGTNALRVTLGTPVVEAGTSNISTSVQAKLSLPRTAPTPTAPSLP